MALELPPLAADDFPSLVEAVHGHRPFPWQEELLLLVLGDEWPTIRVPTGLGKTSVIDVAVFALAMQAHLPPEERTARTRTFFVIDRRLVVDDATAHAKRVAERLAQAVHGHGDDVVGRVARRLLHIGLRPTTAVEPPALRETPAPLAVARMRGGTTWAARWLARPEQPAVVVGTVDQLASRLLFRGYGVTRSSLPIDAALVGSDSLIVLDEAHLARPLRASLTKLMAWEATVPEPVLLQRRARLVPMSATVTAAGGKQLDVSERDRRHPEAGRRLRARKLVTLWDLRTGSTRNRSATSAAFGAVLAEAAERLAADDSVGVVGIVCNTIQTARAVHRLLAEHCHRAELIIGPSREIDRELVMRRVRPSAGIDRARPHPSTRPPLFVVATQTVEVGVNLDFDALVTEVAPLDALAQRLGRLDRLGVRTERRVTTRAVVVHSNALHAEDRLYGEPLATTWQWLESLIAPVTLATPKAAATAPLDGQLDLGPDALGALMKEIDPEIHASRSPRAVSVFPAEHLSDLARTSPRPRLDLDIEPFVRGDQEAQPAVLLAWRADVVGDAENARASAEASISQRPLSSQEQVEVPLWHVQAWLDGLAAEAPLADVPSALELDDLGQADEPRPRPRAFRVDEDGSCTPITSAALRAGDSLVVAAADGGLDAYGWHPSVREPVVDVADLCETRAGVVVRLNERTLSQLSEAAWAAVAAWSPTTASDDALATPDEVRALVSALLNAVRSREDAGSASPYERLFGEILAEFVTPTAWDVELGIPVDPQDGAQPFALLRGRRKSNQLSDQCRSPGDDYRSDATETASGGSRPVTLTEHTAAVRGRARACAERLGIAAPLVDALTIAAELHDVGKADPRFQRMLRGGGDLAYLEGDVLLAKSGIDPADRAAWTRARRDADWPSGLRHEALSVALVDALAADGDALELTDEHVELVRHLVATHHGHSRPLFDPLPSAAFVDLAFEWRGRIVCRRAEELARYLPDWSAPSRMQMLLERHGAWGLALLETILRLADVTCSETGS